MDRPDPDEAPDKLAGAPAAAETPIDLARLQGALHKHFAPWVEQLGLQVVAARRGEVAMRLPRSPALVHAGGVICGAALMAAADSGMVLALITELGAFRPMTTVQFQTSFLHPAAEGDALITTRVLRRGRNLSYGAIEMHDAQGRLVAHATTTFSVR